MTDAWDGRPANPEVDGWHWLLIEGEGPEPAEWRAKSSDWLTGNELWPAASVSLFSSYLGPCAPPGEEFRRGWEAAREAALTEAVKRVYTSDERCGYEAERPWYEIAKAIRAMEPPA